MKWRGRREVNLVYVVKISKKPATRYLCLVCLYICSDEYVFYLSSSLCPAALSYSIIYNAFSSQLYNNSNRKRVDVCI